MFLYIYSFEIPNEIYIKKGSSGEISPAIIKLAKK